MTPLELRNIARRAAVAAVPANPWLACFSRADYKGPATPTALGVRREQRKVRAA